MQVASGSSRRIWLSRFWAVSSVLMLAWTAAVPFLRAYQFRQINYNEGWNIYNAQRVAEHKPLYLSASGWTTVNYPALSFHLAALLHGWTKDFLFTERTVSLVSLVMCGVLAGAIVGLVAHSRRAALLTGMFLVAAFSAAESGGVGTAEPQMLAQALFLAGLYVYIRGQRKGMALEASALLFVLAGNIKHNPIEFPLAVLLDLLLTAPRRALRFAAVCAALAAVSFAITTHVDGAAYVACLLAPRSYFLMLSVWKTVWTLTPMLLPLLAAVWMSRRALGNPACRVLALLLYCALPLNAFFIGGSGVGENALFGTLTAVVVLCGLFWAEVERQPPQWLRNCAPQLVPAVFFFWLTIPLALSGHWRVWKALAQGREDERRFAMEVDFLSRQPGGAICESLLRCYEAGKPYVYDPFNATRFIDIGRLDPDAMVERLKNHEFGAIQMRGSVEQKLLVQRSFERFAPPILKAVDAYYHPAFQNSYGTIYVPMAQGAPALPVAQEPVNSMRQEEP